MITAEDILPELKFKAIRSSGSGGQHVNKVSSKVELRFNLMESTLLSDDHKDLLHKTIAERLTKDDIIILQCDDTRSQHRNKEIVIKRLLDILNRGLIEPKTRKQTKVPKAIRARRLKVKKQVSDKKASRKKPDLD
jgi:ribosome-associated protein